MSLNKKSVDDINVKGKRVLVRCDFNVPLKEGKITDEIVSSDIIGMTYGSLFDATQTMVKEVGDGLYEVQVVSWYDNENSYTSQMVRTIKYFSELA